MSEPLILTIDVGTQSVRAAIFNKKGETIDIQKVKYKPAYYSLKHGYAEQDADFYFEAIASSTKPLLERNSKLTKDLVGVSLTTIRDSAVMLDENNVPLRKMILWLDQRLAKGEEKLPLGSRIIFKLSGMNDTVNLNRSKSISLWLKENELELWNKMSHYVCISGYLNYCLTGVLADSPASEIGHYPMNFKKREWYKSNRSLKGQIFGIDVNKTCPLVQPGGVIGLINKKASEITGIPEGLKLFSVGSDKSCESLGGGVLRDTIASISYGTASTIEVTTKKYHNSEMFLPSYPSCLPGYYNMDVQVYRGYWMLNWFVKEFSKEKTGTEEDIAKVMKMLNTKLNTVPPGSDGLIIQPYWQPALSKALVKGGIIGWSDTHTNAHMYRAIIEGIAYALREGMLGFEKRIHKKINRIMVSGGGSQCDEICQITADVFGLRVSRVQTYETSSLGAAIAGFLAAKEFSTPKEAVSSMVHLSKTFKPCAEVHKQYNIIFYKGYLRMYRSLKSIYKSLRIYGKFHD